MNSEKLSELPQYLVPQRGLTALAGWLANNRTPWLKNYLIQYFIQRYDVDVNAALHSDLAYYPTFNSFFTRYLKPGLRPISSDPEAFVSPADGAISQLGDITDEAIFQAKGFTFTLPDLLGSAEEASAFRSGKFMTIYLSPKDYHRVHMPLTGRLRKAIFIPGKLFSVNQKTVRSVPNLFARNERLVCLFETDMGPLAVILVGAMLVGSIGTVWQDTVFATQVTEQHFSGDQARVIQRGEEIGHFKMGSTVIVLAPEQSLTWQAELQADSALLMGQEIGKILNPSLSK